MARTYSKKDTLTMLKKDELVTTVAKFSNEKLGHLFQLSPEQIANVLTALAYYCEDEGKKATSSIYQQICLRMIQFEDGACGHRFETWFL